VNQSSLSNPMSAQDIAQTMQLIQQAAASNPALRAQIASMATSSQRVGLTIPYWSVVEFSAAPVAGAITLNTQRRVAFQYAQGADMAVAGAPGRIAGYADTNLQRAGETLSNADVWIYGVAIEIEASSEPKILEALFDDCYVDLSTDGQNSIRLGTLAMFPSAGGLYGTGYSADVVPDLATSGKVTDLGQGGAQSYLQNGNPIASSFLKFPAPFIWGGVGQGGADASLSIGLQLSRERTITLPAARVAAAGVAPYTPPAAAGDPGTYARLRVRLVSQSLNKRSNNT